MLIYQGYRIDTVRVCCQFDSCLPRQYKKRLCFLLLLNKMVEVVRVCHSHFNPAHGKDDDVRADVTDCKSGGFAERCGSLSSDQTGWHSSFLIPHWLQQEWVKCRDWMVPWPRVRLAQQYQTWNDNLSVVADFGKRHWLALDRVAYLAAHSVGWHVLCCIVPEDSYLPNNSLFPNMCPRYRPVFILVIERDKIYLPVAQ